MYYRAQYVRTVASSHESIKPLLVLQCYRVIVLLCFSTTVSSQCHSQVSLSQKERYVPMVLSCNSTILLPCYIILYLSCYRIEHHCMTLLSYYGIMVSPHGIAIVTVRQHYGVVVLSYYRRIMVMSNCRNILSSCHNFSDQYSSTL